MSDPTTSDDAGLRGAGMPASDNDQQIQQQPVTPAPVAKEQKDAFASGEAVRPVEVREEAPREEVESWLERLERGEDINLPQPVRDDKTGQVLVEPARATEPDLILPITEVEAKRGLHFKVWHSLRWLAEWSMRVLKMFPGKVAYKEG